MRRRLRHAWYVIRYGVEGYRMGMSVHPDDDTPGRRHARERMSEHGAWG